MSVTGSNFVDGMLASELMGGNFWGLNPGPAPQHTPMDLGPQVVEKTVEKTEYVNLLPRGASVMLDMANFYGKVNAKVAPQIIGLLKFRREKFDPETHDLKKQLSGTYRFIDSRLQSSLNAIQWGYKQEGLHLNENTLKSTCDFFQAMNLMKNLNAKSTLATEMAFTAGRGMF